MYFYGLSEPWVLLPRSSVSHLIRNLYNNGKIKLPKITLLRHGLGAPIRQVVMIIIYVTLFGLAKPKLGLAKNTVE